MRKFAATFAVSSETNILDVGGLEGNWHYISVTPHLTLLNLDAKSMPVSQDLPAPVRRVVADGRHLPFSAGAFDIVFSNSVIEHLGDYQSQVAFADEARRVGRAYFIQTPNRTFFVEPHFLAPFIHFLPISWQRRLIPRFTIWGLMTRARFEDADRLLAELRLLDDAEFRNLFPDAQVVRERLWGMVKSLIAVRTG